MDTDEIFVLLATAVIIGIIAWAEIRSRRRQAAQAGKDTDSAAKNAERRDQ